MSKQKNILIGAGIAIAFAFFLIFGNLFTIGIDTYIPYSIPNGIVNGAEWNTQDMRRSFDLDNHPTFRQIEPNAENQSVFLMTHVGEGGFQGPGSSVYTEQDLKGKDFRVFYFAEFLAGWSASVSLKDIGCGAVIRPNEVGGVELQPSILNENQVLFKVNGRNVCEITVANETKIQVQFSLSSPGNTPSQQGYITLSAPGYRLPLGCAIGPHDVAVFEAFDSESNVDVFALGYHPKRICEVIVQRPTAIGPDKSQEVAQLLAQGQIIRPRELFEPDTNIAVIYTVDNSDNIVPITCSSQEILVDGSCAQRNRLVQLCVRGVLNVNDLSCTTQKQICEGTLVQVNETESICRFRAPVGQVCVSVTFNPVPGTCDVPADNGKTYDCKSLGYEEDPARPGLCISYLKDEKTLDIAKIMIFIVFVGIAVLILFAVLRIFNLLFWVILIATIAIYLLRFIL